MTNYESSSNKNSKILFSVICLCIISLGVIVYFVSARSVADSVNEPTTVEVSTEVKKTVENIEKEITTKVQQSTKIKEKTTMELNDTNTPYLSFYKYPLTDKIVKDYSEELVFDKTMEDFRAHTGVDFLGKAGDEVVAINDGLVLSTEKDKLYGNVVKIDHGGKLVAVYAGLKNVNVKKGDVISIGEEIGTLGEIPCESAEKTHLHLEIIYKGKHVNPLEIMSKSEKATTTEKSNTAKTGKTKESNNKKNSKNTETAKKSATTKKTTNKMAGIFE